MIDGGEEHSEGQDIDFAADEGFRPPELLPRATLYNNVLVEIQRRVADYKERKLPITDHHEHLAKMTKLSA